MEFLVRCGMSPSGGKREVTVVSYRLRYSDLWTDLKPELVASSYGPRQSILDAKMVFFMWAAQAAKF